MNCTKDFRLHTTIQGLTCVLFLNMSMNVLMFVCFEYMLTSSEMEFLLRVYFRFRCIHIMSKLECLSVELLSKDTANVYNCKLF